MKVPFFVAESLLWTQEIKIFISARAEIKDVIKEHINGMYTTEPKLMKFTRYELITIWPHPFSLSSEWFFCGSHCWHPVNPTYYFLWIFLWFLTQHPNPTSQSTPTTMAKQVFKGYGVGGTLPSPAHLHPGERQDSPWHFMSRHIEQIIILHISFTLGWWGSKSSPRCLVIPSGCKQGAHALERDVS